MKQVFLTRAFVLVAVLVGFSHLAVARTTSAVATSSAGEVSNDDVGGASISDDGRYLVFSTEADNIIANDINGEADIFLKDMETGEITLVSRPYRSNEVVRGGSTDPKISGDGRFVVFGSLAMNLTQSVTGGFSNIFLYDRLGGDLVQVSTALDGGPINQNVLDAKLSANGQFVVFAADASNLVAGDTNNNRDVYIYDVLGRTTRRLSIQANGTEFFGDSFAPEISADGRLITFNSTATNFPGAGTGRRGVYLVDQFTDTLRLLQFPDEMFNSGTDALTNWHISATGRYLMFQRFFRAQFEMQDLVLYDRTNQEFDVITVDLGGSESTGTYGLGGFSGDERYFQFSGTRAQLISGVATNTTHIYRYEMGDGGLELVSTNSALEPADGENRVALGLTGDGQGSLFLSRANNLSESDDDSLENLFLVDTSEFDANDNVSGSWLNTQEAGHGFIIEVLDANRILIYWFTFDADGNRLWMVATSDLLNNKATLDAYIVSGGVFPPFFDPNLIVNQLWGTLEVEFLGCNSATISWVPLLSGFSAGSMNLSRLTQIHGLDCS